MQRNFIAQTGDPTGTGKGGESVYMKAYGDQARYFEMEMKPKIKHKKKGLISFANNGNNLHGSQFFLTLADDLDYLDGKHTVFGEIAEGYDILDKINQAICDEVNRPYQDIRINHTIVLEDPFEDPSGLDIPNCSPEPTKQQLQSDRIGADEDIEEHRGKSLQEIQEVLDEKDLNIGTQILETVGDIPDAELKPPENVLFVCKLNPVTTAEDLEIIFSRFGPILSCEIIGDHKSGDSLCYGFVEFEKVDDCEKAYFKMDNVLIDDRRIHVNFCQSIPKNKWSNSGLHSKYSFPGKDGPKESNQFKSAPAKFAMKDKGTKEKYEMVFHENMDDKIIMSKDKRERKKLKETKQFEEEDQPRKTEKRKHEAHGRREQSRGGHDSYHHPSNRERHKKSHHQKRRDSSEDSSDRSRSRERRKKIDKAAKHKRSTEPEEKSRKHRMSSSDSDDEHYRRNKKEKKPQSRNRTKDRTRRSSSEDSFEHQERDRKRSKEKKHRRT